MKTIFGVFHVYDVDGGFGDAVGCKDLLCVFASKEEANAFVKTYSKPHIYEVPYLELECGRLVVEELPTAMDKSRMWWLEAGIFKYQGFEVFDYEDSDEEPLPMASPEEMDTEWDKLPKFASFAHVA